jgi:hypothetical protein
MGWSQTLPSWLVGRGKNDRKQNTLAPISSGGPNPQSTYIGRYETGSVYLPIQLERTLQLYW